MHVQIISIREIKQNKKKFCARMLLECVSTGWTPNRYSMTLTMCVTSFPDSIKVCLSRNKRARMW
jgi:hypothetical protein